MNLDYLKDKDPRTLTQSEIMDLTVWQGEWDLLMETRKWEERQKEYKAVKEIMGQIGPPAVVSGLGNIDQAKIARQRLNADIVAARNNINAMKAGTKLPRQREPMYMRPDRKPELEQYKQNPGGFPPNLSNEDIQKRAISDTIRNLYAGPSALAGRNTPDEYEREQTRRQQGDYTTRGLGQWGIKPGRQAQMMRDIENVAMYGSAVVPPKPEKPKPEKPPITDLSKLGAKNRKIELED